MVDDGWAVGDCSIDGVAVLELASGSGDEAVGVGLCRDDCEFLRSVLEG